MWGPGFGVSASGFRVEKGLGVGISGFFLLVSDSGHFDFLDLGLGGLRFEDSEASRY